MPIVFWFSRLKPGIMPGAYERWVRDVDYHEARQIPSIRSYHVFRVNGPYVGETTPCDYVEVVDITNIDDYRRDIAEHPAAARIVAEIGKYVESIGSAWGDLIDR